jgi:hypothetical protein
MEPFTDPIGLRAFHLGPRVIDSTAAKTRTRVDPVLRSTPYLDR